MIRVAGQTLTITQGGTTCAYSVDTTVRSFGLGGGVGTIDVDASPGCQWSALSSSSWIIINSGSSGTGNGTVNFTVSANAGPVRVGQIKVAGRAVTIKQKGKAT